jgi:hypothetical protein
VVGIDDKYACVELSEITNEVIDNIKSLNRKLLADPSRTGGVKLGRKTIGKRHRRSLIELNDKLRKLRNLLSFRQLHRHLCQVLSGYFNYYGFAGNAATLGKYAYAVGLMWFKWLNRHLQESWQHQGSSKSWAKRDLFF